MFTEKSKVLADAPSILNKPDQPFEVTVEGDCIIAYWKWMDETRASSTSVSSKKQDYTFTVTLKDNGKYKELDKSSSTAAGASLSGRAKFEKSMFVGKKSQKSFEFKLGKNKDTGKIEASTIQFDTSLVKRPIREYLKACGWKKAGLF